jgi:prepilin-type N-terminal cleavage/methylation domain-containing protein
VSKYASGQSGLTLIELIIVVLLLAGVSMQDQLRAIEDRMIRDLRGSKNVAQQNLSPTVSRLYFSPSAVLNTTDTGTYYEYNSTSAMLYRALSGTKNPLSEANIVGPFPPWTVTTISTVGQTITATIFSIDVGLVTSEKGITYSTSFSISPRTWK